MTVSLPIARRMSKCAPSGLVAGACAIYLCNEGSGTVLKDYSGNGNHGTFGAAGAAPAYSATGIEFDTDEYIDCGTWRASSPDGAGLTATAVVTVSSVATDYGIVSQYNPAGDNRAWALATVSDTIQVTIGDNGTNAAGHLLQARSGNVLTTASAHMISFTFDAGALAIYSGATPQALTVMKAGPATVYNPAQPVEIGRHLGGLYLAGTVHAIAIYPFALAPAQVGQNYIALKAALAPRGVTVA